MVGFLISSFSAVSMPVDFSSCDWVQVPGCAEIEALHSLKGKQIPAQSLAWPAGHSPALFSWIVGPFLTSMGALITVPVSEGF